MEQDAQFHFRTAVGGFHKGDVAEYISKNAAGHQAALAEKDRQIRSLEQQNQALILENSILRRENSQGEASAEPAQPPAEPALSSVNQLELAAYRRAEAAERMALQRSRQVYEALNEICQDAAGGFQSANRSAQEAVNEILARMDDVHGAYSTLFAALDNAQQRLEAINAMSPDPAEPLTEAEETE